MYVIKECSKCKEHKLLSEFGKQINRPFGVSADCKACIKKRGEVYREQNKERINERNKQYHQQNKEYRNERTKQYDKQNKEQRKEYWEKNKERISEQRKQFREQNKERINERQKQYREQNKEHVSEVAKQYYKQRRQTDPLFKMRCTLRNLIGMSMKNQGYTKKSKTYNILGVDFETFKKHIERQFTKGMTWNNHGEWHYDHIIPVSSAKTEEEVLKLNHYTNFQPLWAADNRLKSDKIVPAQVMLRI